MGQIECAGHDFKLFDFRSERYSEFHQSYKPLELTTLRGHGFADYHLMKASVKVVALNDASVINSGPEDSLRGHRSVFAAERSRRQGGVMLEVDI